MSLFFLLIPFIVSFLPLVSGAFELTPASLVCAATIYGLGLKEVIINP